ncbi:PhpK family radical SAM P-methyltransferase [Desulfosediminicola flagellatus]|uniref:PhpK family radical SAM P-methyltransferase n=1 Tax=Desulfosediminicola flagellatus TaxID=2569541 RepID=UPI00142EA1ED|nr:PhpK family radical SAM P-methyltransferase [Desulfosediminicola flagellatus]
MTDCLLIGFNEGDPSEICSNIKGMGERSTAWRDVRTSVVSHEGKYLRALDVLTLLANKDAANSVEMYHNMDLLSPAILYLGSFIKDQGFSFDYINLFHQEKEQLKSKLLAGDVCSIAITTTLYVTPEPILEIVTFIRQYDPKVKIIIGGPYILKETIHADPSEIQRLFKYLDADFYVMTSEGEKALSEILSALKSGSNFEHIPNCAYRLDSHYHINSLIPEENFLEDTLIDYTSFPCTDLGENISVRTALSCPFSCAFCGFPQKAGRHRAADLAHVEKEIDVIHNLGNVSTITFLDDSFNVPRKRFREMLKMMIRKRYQFKWNSFLRCDHVDAEIIELMKEAGCEGVFIGAESGNDEMLRRMNKTVRRHHFSEIVPLFKKAGIASHMSLIVGFPGETDDSVRDTISLIEESQPDFYRAQLWYCDPMTPIWEKREHYGIKGAGFNWTHNSMSSQKAMDWVEEIFMSVSDSLWLPQYGFELWSIFYLQRKGMSLPQVKQFLTCFNSAVKEQIIDSTLITLSNNTIENLKAVCSFDSTVMPSSEPIKPGYVEHYRQATMFWKKVYESLQLLTPKAIGLPKPNEEPSQDVPLIKGSILGEVARQLKVEEQILALALYTAILSRFYGEFQVSLGVISTKKQHFPLSIKVNWEGPFREHLDAIHTTLRESSIHAEYMTYFLNSPFHVWADTKALSQLQAGFFMADSADVDDKEENYFGRIPLQLVWQGNGDDSFLILRSVQSFMSPETAQDFARFFNEALNEVLQNQNRLIVSLLASEGAEHHDTDDAEECVEFQF